MLKATHPGCYVQRIFLWKLSEIAIKVQVQGYNCLRSYTTGFSISLDLGSLSKVALSNLSNLKFCQKKERGREMKLACQWFSFEKVMKFVLLSGQLFVGNLEQLGQEEWQPWLWGRWMRDHPHHMGGARGLPKRKLDAITQPKCTQRKHLKYQFFREGVEKIHTSLTKPWNRPLERNIKEERKLPNNVFV